MLTFRLQKLTVLDIQVSTSRNSLLQKKRQVKLVLNVLLLTIFTMAHVHMFNYTHNYMYLPIFLSINLSTYKNSACIVFSVSPIANLTVQIQDFRKAKIRRNTVRDGKTIKLLKSTFKEQKGASLTYLPEVFLVTATITPG